MIETERLNLVACRIEHFVAFERNENELAETFGVEIADGWLIFPEVVSYSREFLKANPTLQIGGCIFSFTRLTGNLSATEVSKANPTMKEKWKLVTPSRPRIAEKVWQPKRQKV